MADTYVYLIHESDWDSDALLGGGPDVDMDASFPEHEAFQKAVADLGARIVGGAALQNSRHGGTVTPGADDRLSRTPSTPTARSPTPPRSSPASTSSRPTTRTPPAGSPRSCRPAGTSSGARSSRRGCE